MNNETDDTENSNLNQHKELAEENSDEENIGPKDKGNVVWWIFLLWGVGVLLPWNAVLSTFDYFEYETKGYSLSPSFVYPFAVNGLAVLAQMLVLLYGHKLTDQTKIQTGMYINGLIMFAIPFVSHFIKTPATCFWVCFFVLFVFGGNNGMVQASVFGGAGFLPGKYVGAIMFGNGLSGIGTNLLKVVFMLALPGDDNLFKVALIYFITCGFFMIFSGYLFTVLQKNEFYTYQKELSLRKGSTVSGKDDEPLTFAQFWTQFKKNMSHAWKILFALSLVFICTFVVFPGAFFNEHFGFMDALGTTEFSWYVITVILIFNIFDTTGRKLASYVSLRPTSIILLSYLRIGMVFLTIFLTQKDSEKVTVFETDPFRLLNLIVFSISNGYLSTQACIKAPGFVPKDQQHQIGLLNGLSIQTGILIGAMIAVPVGSFLNSHWAS